MSYQIITDSCCDFTGKQYRDLKVSCAPLSVVYKGKSHDNFTDLWALKRFYDDLRSGEMPTTSAVNPDGWANAMKPVLEAGEDVLILAVSSGLSATYQSAVIAAEEMGELYPNRTIRVVDTLCAALGQGLLVWYACQKRDAGMGLDELTQWLEENKLHICHWVTVDDLNHLKRGGRIGAATAILGGMLNIKPMIFVDNEGHLVNTAKVRGRKAAMEFIVKKFGETGTDFDNETVFIGHGDCPEDAKTLEQMLRKAHPQIKNIVTGYVGPVIGAHTGPGVLVLFYMGNRS